VRNRIIRISTAVTAAVVLGLVAALPAVAAKPTVTVKGTAYSKKFTVTSCKNTGETDLVLTGKAPGLTLRLSGNYKSGSMKIRGLININGKLTSIAVGDAGNIKAKGVFVNTVGVKGPFTVTGRCA